ncbi:MAG: diguanylate cyclase [Nitrospinae bacterium]|nr:diguanylate cyclase [Nitrospinota bacterium]
MNPPENEPECKTAIQEPIRFIKALFVFHLFVLLAIFGLTAPAYAFPLESEKEMIALGPNYMHLEDSGRNLDVKDVISGSASARFKPLGMADPNLGYSQSVIWLRADIENHLEKPSDWLIEIPFPTLDSISVFLIDKETNGIISSQSAGDLKPFAERPYSHRNFVFPITLPPSKKLAALIRVDSRGSLTVSSFLWPPSLFHKNSRNAYFALSLYFGVLIALFAYNLLLYLSLGDRVYFYYILFVGAMALGQFSWNGLGSEYLWPNLPAWGNVASIAGFDATGLFGAVFSRAFLSTRRSAPSLDKVIVACAIVFALLLVTIPVTPYQFNAKVTSVTGVVFSLVATLSGIVCLARGFNSARYFLLAWTILLLGTAALGARNLGWIPTNFFTLHAMQIGSALEMILLSFALAERINDLRREKEAAQIEVYETRRTMIETLERKERDLDERVNARTRELQDLNLRLMESEAHLRKMANHDHLTGLANRSLLDERLLQAIERAKRNKNKIAILLADLDGFKPVNDNHGHDVGDELLRVIANRLKATVRSSDTVARIGGDEFVLLLDTIKHPLDAVSMAEKALTAIREPVNARGAVLAVSASIGVAIFPDDGVEAETLVKHADRAMYNAKLAGRNQLRLADGSNTRIDGVPQ